MAEENIGEHQFLWQIENFSASPSYYICSPIIRARDLYDSHWNILLATRDDFDDRFISVDLFRASSDNGPTHLHLELEVCLIDVDGEERLKRRFSCIIKQFTITSFHKFVRRSYIFENKDILQPNNVLTLLFRVRKSELVKFSATKSVLRTKIDVERSSFLWTIRGLTRKASVNKRVFQIQSNTAMNGLELVCECGNTIDEQKTLRSEYVLRLTIKPKYVPKVRIFMSATILAQDSHLKPPAKIEAEHFFEAKSNDTWHLPSLDISDRMQSLLDEDRLDLVCDFSISDGSQDKQMEATLISLPDKFYLEENTLLQDIRSVYESIINITPDILLDVCNGMQHFRAHKIILSARSLVFREILNNFDVEKKRCFDLLGTDANIPSIHNAVCVRHENIKVYVLNGMDYAQILHISPNILEQMLKCMYTDTLNPDDVINAMQLFSAGVRFDFGLLREKSEKYLKSKISLKSLYPILEFAHLTGVVRLKCECLNFISKNREIILASNEWVTLSKRHEDLAQEISNIIKSEVNN